MAKVTFTHPEGSTAPWQVGEVIVVQVSAVNAYGSYECETIETIPGNVKELHTTELEQVQRMTQTVIAQHEATIASLQGQVAALSAPTPSQGGAVR